MNETRTASAESELLPEPEPANLIRRDDRPQQAPLRGTVVRDADVARIDRVIVRQTDEINHLVEALAAAQAEDGYGDIGKSRTARVEGKNSGVKFTYEYETLADVIDATRPHLARNKVVVLQFPFTGGSTMTIRTRLVHASGQWIESDLVAHIVSLGPQDVASGISYLRRYAQKAILNLAAYDDDDDAQAAPGGQRPPKAATRRSEQHAGADSPRPSAPVPQAPAPAAAAPAPAKSADPTIGTIPEGADHLGAKDGVTYVRLSTGFRCATRDPELAKALARHQANGATVELRCNTPKAGFAPTLVEIVEHRTRW